MNETGSGPRRPGGRLQRRTLLVLSLATVLGGLGVGASLSVGALLLAELSGDDAISGLASAVFNAGAAAAGIPLARLAARRGRRRALVAGSLLAMVGAFVAIVASVLVDWRLLALGIALMGVSSAVQLLARFAATDLAEPGRQARDLSLVVWSITVGAVVGPNLMEPGARVGEAIGVTPLAGVFVFTLAAQALGALVTAVGLRPDPLLTARAIAARARDASEAVSRSGHPGAGAVRGTEVSRPGARVLVIIVIAAAQAVMVALMAMTPLHLMHHAGTPQLVGFTLSLHIAGMYALSPVFGSLASRVGRLQVIVLGWTLLLASVALAFVAGPSHVLVQIALTLLGLGWSAVTVAGAALLTELTPTIERPKWQGRSDTVMSGAGALAGALSGVVFAVGGFSVLALAACGVLALGVLAWAPLARRPAGGTTEARASR